MLTAFLIVALAQAGEGEAPAEPPAAPPAAAEPGATPEAPPPAAPVRNKQGDEASRAVKKAMELPEDQRGAALEAVKKQYGGVEISPVLPPNAWVLDKYLGLTALEQAKLVAREFMEDLIAGDARGLVMASGLPFWLEDRRIERADDLRTEWARLLRSRRADLLTLYGIEVLTPSEMEKKYGRPPQRLASWKLSGADTYLAVANVSGHATILLLKQSGLAWQVLGFHD